MSSLLRSRPGPFLIPACLAIFLSVAPSVASAFQIMSALTEPCHEQITMSAIGCVGQAIFATDAADCLGSPIFPPVGVAVDSDVVGVANLFSRELGVEFDSDRTRLIALSLLAGARFPDTRGGSSYDTNNGLRPLLLSDDHEHCHFVRRSFDDGPEGSLDAALASRKFMEGELLAAIESSAMPLGDRFVVHSLALDFYGEVEVELYEPLFRLGVALHTFEDSFAHALRTADLVGVVSVLNSIDALSGTLQEDRDGIAHSMAMDSCMEEGWPLAGMAARATADLVDAVAVDAASGNGDAGMAGAVLDSWISVVPGCGIDNGYCQTPWLTLARTDPFEPIIPMVLGCGAGTTGKPWPMALLMVPFLVFCFRRSR